MGKTCLFCAKYCVKKLRKIERKTPQKYRISKKCAEATKQLRHILILDDTNSQLA
jgi:hypothetical protein